MITQVVGIPMQSLACTDCMREGLQGQNYNLHILMPSPESKLFLTRMVGTTIHELYTYMFGCDTC